MSAPKRTDLKHILVNGITLYIFPKNKSLYHGTIANTEKDPSNYNKLIKKLTKLDTGFLTKYKTLDLVKSTFYLSSKNIADNYGCNKDSSCIVTALHHSITNKGEKPNRKHVVPLYYVKGEHGVTIEFNSIIDLRLFDLGNIENIKILVAAITNCNTLNKEEKKNYLEAFNNTCFTAEYDDNYEIIRIKECKRISTEWFDPELVQIICSLWNIHLLNLPKIDGWIYFENENTNFHFEILLCRPSKILNYIKTHTVPDTIYEGIQTWDEFRNMLPKFKGHTNTIMLTNNIISQIKVDYDKSVSISPFFDATQS